MDLFQLEHGHGTTCPVKCGMKSLIHSQTSTVQSHTQTRSVIVNDSVCRCVGGASQSVDTVSTAKFDMIFTSLEITDFDHGFVD